MSKIDDMYAELEKETFELLHSLEKLNERGKLFNKYVLVLVIVISFIAVLYG